MATEKDHQRGEEKLRELTLTVEVVLIYSKYLTLLHA